LAFPQRHDIDTIDHGILVDLARLEMEFIQKIPRQQEYVASFGMTVVMIALETTCGYLNRVQKYGLHSLSGFHGQ
jgi:hypothetical protein